MLLSGILFWFSGSHRTEKLEGIRPTLTYYTELMISRNVRYIRPLGRSLRQFQTSPINRHENPLGLPRIGRAPSSPSNATPEVKGERSNNIPKQNPPQVPRMSKGLPIRQKIPGVSKILLVSSAKGGVGKSTVSANLALALKSLGNKVGLLDADVFGPSVPRLFNLSGEPRISSTGKLLPLSNYGVETMSIGYMISPENAVVWRGLMVMKALQQLLFEVQWSNLDYLVIDMPPGTGDTQLTIAQQLKIDGAIIVSTPQDIALIDAVKGITMFNKVNIPILGLVQNMSYYICPNCNHEAHIFGSEGARREAKNHNLELLTSIPLNEEICVQSDSGKPIVVVKPDDKVAALYFELAKKVVASISKN